MEIRIKESGQVVSENEFRAMHPNTSFPATLTLDIVNEFGGDPVLEAPAPAVTDTQIAYRDGVQQDGLGNWVYKWAVRELTAEEIEARKPPVPQSVTRRQALQQLRIEGITEDQIITNINAMVVPQLQKDLAIIEFKESQVFERSRPLVSQLGAMLGKDAAGIDAMFIAAAKL
jgi:hypothetical protein